MTDLIDKNIRVRFAPSPTGFLHIGGLRSALYNYLFAQKNQGTMLLRVEDTDQKRYVAGSIEKLVESLSWSGLDWQEGVFLKNSEFKKNTEKIKIENSKNYLNLIEKGEFGPYIQSERLEIYQQYAKQLIQEGKAYYCFCKPQRLEEMREQQINEKKAPMYDRFCLYDTSAEKINENLKKQCPHTIRLKIPREETLIFEDVIRGKVSFSTNTIDDQVLIKSDGFPTYHLASVVDDHLMKITHVIRGEEWLPSTPKHILLYRAFGWKVPTFAHLPLLLNSEKKKLSKRQGDVAVEDYVKKGYLKEALINFVALLGWNPGNGQTQEIFSLSELTKNFKLTKVHKAGAVFDLKKLDWINGQYIKKMSLSDLFEKTQSFLKIKSFFLQASSECQAENFVKKVLTLEQERLTRLDQVGEENQFFFLEKLDYGANLLLWKEMSFDEVKNNLQKALELLASISILKWEREHLMKKMLELAGENRGEFLWPLRVALTGEQKSPSPSDVAWVLGQKKSILRIKNALEIIARDIQSS